MAKTPTGPQLLQTMFSEARLGHCRLPSNHSTPRRFLRAVFALFLLCHGGNRRSFRSFAAGFLLLLLLSPRDSNKQPTSSPRAASRSRHSLTSNTSDTASFSGCPMRGGTSAKRSSHGYLCCDPNKQTSKQASKQASRHQQSFRSAAVSLFLKNTASFVPDAIRGGASDEET